MTFKKHRVARRRVLDKAALSEVLLTVRAYLPAAAKVALRSSDRGFRLEDVLDAADAPLLQFLPQDARNALDGEIARHLVGLDHGGVVGEDENGYAEVVLPMLGADGSTSREHDG